MTREEILYPFNHVELASLKHTVRIPTSVPIPTALDERGRLWYSCYGFVSSINGMSSEAVSAERPQEKASRLMSFS
jgi:hypothetical protein